jgi:hypothetical protein
MNANSTEQAMESEKDKYRVTLWLEPTAQNVVWLNDRVCESKDGKPGRQERVIIREKVDGKYTGRIALARVEMAR